MISTVRGRLFRPSCLTCLFRQSSDSKLLKNPTEELLKLSKANLLSESQRSFQPTVEEIKSSQSYFWMSRSPTMTWTHQNRRYFHTCGRLDSDSASGGGTVDADELRHFSENAHAWWDEGGEFSALHTMNRLRVPLIRDALVRDINYENPAQCLSGFNILDVGCGGGILTEPLARLGASVTGVDASAENIQMAKWHAATDPVVARNVRYRACTVESLVEQEAESYDAVVASEIIEHVADAKLFVSACCKLLRPGGSIFVTTINKTALSYSLAVVGAEQVMRLVKPGTHDWNKFIAPNHLEALLEENDCHTQLLHGMWLNPITLRWSWADTTSVNYALHAVKEDFRAVKVAERLAA